eukprot:1181520-Prorocentrum_minimum.AAC.1
MEVIGQAFETSPEDGAGYNLKQLVMEHNSLTQIPKVFLRVKDPQVRRPRSPKCSSGSNTR